MTAAHPAVDFRTDRVAVVMQDRPVVPLSSWLADVIRICAANGKGLQLVTPAASRLTTALHQAFTGPDSRWVADGPGGHHDGHTGRRLGWTGDMFAPLDPAALAPAFTGGPPAPAWHHGITVQLRHRPVASLTLGGALEQLVTALTGAPPAGWGTAEPATQPWSRASVTELCRARAPRRTWICAVSSPSAAGLVDGPVLATMVVSRTDSWVLETIRCTAVHSEPLPAGALLPVLAALGDDVRQALVQQVPGRPDATCAPQWTGLSTPVAILAGPEATEGRRPGDLTGVGELAHRWLGRSLWYELRDPGEDPAQAWSRLEQVMAHLMTPALTADLPREWGQPEHPAP